MRQLLTLLLILTICLPAMAQEKGISVSGKGVVLAAPDSFTLSVQVKERGMVAQKVKSIVDSKSSQIVSMLKKYGITDKQITSSQLSLYPIFQKPSVIVNESYVKSPIDKGISKVVNSNKDKQVLVYDVSRTIEIDFRDADKYDVLLDLLVKLGVTNISPLQKKVKDSEGLYQQAMIAAIADAKQKAKLMAEQLNVKVGQVVNIKESSSYNAPVRYRMEAMAAAPTFQSNFGENEITAQVVVVFSILPR